MLEQCELRTSRCSEAPIPWSEADPFSISMYAQAFPWELPLQIEPLSFVGDSAEQWLLSLRDLGLALELCRSQHTGAASKKTRR